MLDDIARTMTGLGIPFVGGAACDANQPAWGPNDAWVGDSDLGSFWTNSLVGAMAGAQPGDTVTGTIATANANDPTATGGAYTGSLPPGGQPERPQNISAHGGDAVTWGSGVGVVFSGNNTDERHDNNVDNMEAAFANRLGAALTPTTGTAAGLQSALNLAASLAGTGELALYVDDHGDTEFDVDEWTGR